MPFTDIYGHVEQISLLKRALIKGQLPQAYLFHGMSGIGKRTVALTLARAANCAVEINQGDACEICPSCKKIKAMHHPDVFVLKAEGQFIRIHQIRELQERMSYRPFEGRLRIVILLAADRMNMEAANSLLKTLEEPAPDNLIILITSRPWEIPLTILSRCQKVRFNPLPGDTVASFLQKTLSLPAGEAFTLARAGGGSIGRALEMNNKSYLDMRKAIIDTFIGGKNLMMPILIDVLGQDNMVERLKVLKSCYRDVLYYLITGKRDGLLNYDSGDLITSYSQGKTEAEMIRNIEAIDRAIWAIEYNANKQLTLEALLIRIGC